MPAVLKPSAQHMPRAHLWLHHMLAVVDFGYIPYNLEVRLHTVAVDRHTAEVEHTMEQQPHTVGREQVAGHTVAAAVQYSCRGEHIPEYMSRRSQYIVVKVEAVADIELVVVEDIAERIEVALVVELVVERIGTKVLALLEAHIATGHTLVELARMLADLVAVECTHESLVVVRARTYMKSQLRSA